MTEQELVWLEPSSPKEIIEDELVKKYKKDKFIVLYSGGSDSGCVDDFIATKFPEYYEGRLFTNTGIGSPMTREFALQNSKELGRKIEMTWARKSYYDITMNVGFRGMGAHRIIMGYLKAQSWYWYMKPLKRTGNYCFISGVRKKESWTRDKIKFYTKKPIDVNAGDVFCKPFLWKNGTQMQEYKIKHGVKKSPTYEFFNKSGDCWCGTQNHPWELKQLQYHDPFIFNTIKWLEQKVQEKIYHIRNVEIPNAIQLHKETRSLIKHATVLESHSHWGRSGGTEATEDQLTLDDFNALEIEMQELQDLLGSNVVDNCVESCEVS